MHVSHVRDTCSDTVSSSDDTLEPLPMKDCPVLGHQIPQADIGS